MAKQLFGLIVATILFSIPASAIAKLTLVVENNSYNGIPVQPTLHFSASTNAPSGTLISFAAQPGAAAFDDGKHGLYTKSLLNAMDENIPIEQMLKRVASGVKQDSAHIGTMQEPWAEGNVEGEFYFHRGSMSDQRVALVIGNSAYTSISPLENSANDARAIAAKLKELGFDVIEYENLQKKQLGDAMREFRSRLKPGAVALFFYAGHGLQINGKDYMPLVDAEISGEGDVPQQSLAVDSVLEAMDETKVRLKLLFFDTARNNPFAWQGR